MLPIFHYIVGGIIALFALFPLIYLVLGIVFLVDPEAFESDGEPAPASFGWFLIAIWIVVTALILTPAVCIIMTGRFIAKRRHRTFCIVMAGIKCLFQPFGTILGILTIVVLLRQSVKELFEAQPSNQAKLE